ncbi:hypothetical protein KRR55_04580 [Paeniglutamicibacter sp. ABSL32-1]|uniref:hypothetical protein n=1 Tax=Paeniglutamicibacter quisquiliarum TaxID=2849498 RepID=UPI001C2D8E59|nr:hypothetical protein [Paeniglutamicibacter quisquiliarum]MBV1778390.1 hypothetical protein [Paeniglutamicibacter quisquiliarum]
MVAQNDGDGVGAGNQDPDTEFSEQDLLLGRKASKFFQIICVAAFVVCVIAAIFVFMNVPLDTRMPYEGKYDRSGSGIPMPIALIMSPAVLVLLWRTGNKPDSNNMRKGSRIALYIIGPVFVAVCVYYHFVFAEGILVEGGYLAG